MREMIAKSLISRKTNCCNVYRGCEHGCIYCDSRSKVYNIEGEFSDIIVKKNSLELARIELSKRRSKSVITSGSMTDPYTISEEKLEITKGLLEIIYEFGFGAGILTKSKLALRDIDLLDKINKKYKSIVCYTITTLDDVLAKVIEPHASLPSERLYALNEFNKRGITTGVWMGPILPFVTDTIENIKSIVIACHEVGVKYIVCFGIGTTMRDGSRDYFYKKLDESFPGLKRRYQKLYGLMYDCKSPKSEEITKVFKELCQKYNIAYKWEDINKIINYRTKLNVEQISLFE